MKKIFYIMGRSGTGKSYLFNKLKSDPIIKKHCEKITLYTTRPIRAGEVEGDEYNFVAEEAFKTLCPIETRLYNVIVNGEPAVWRYSTCIDNIDVENNYYIGVGTLDSYQKIQEYYFDRYGADILVPIYIVARDEDLLTHYFNREINSTKNYDEMCRRFLADKQDFTQEKLDELGITNKNTYMNYYNSDDLYHLIAREILSDIILNEKQENGEE